MSALGPLQGAEVLRGVLVRRRVLDQETDHERGVDHLPEPLLLQDVGVRAEDVPCLDSAVQQQLHPVQRAAHELQLDVLRAQQRFKRLER